MAMSVWLYGPGCAVGVRWAWPLRGINNLTFVHNFVHNYLDAIQADRCIASGRFVFVVVDVVFVHRFRVGS